VDKNCFPWSKLYFEDNLIDTSFEEGDISYTVVKVDSISGDCDVTQRKGKVLCIYDLSLDLSVDGTNGDEKFTAKISIPELVHDQDEDDYEFRITSDYQSAEIRKHLVPILKAKLLKFQDDLLKAHEKDVQHQTE
jgi:activator of HSP90 ATPase